MRKTELHLAARQFAAADAKHCFVLPSPAELVGALLTNGGGVEQFVDEWHKQLVQARKDHPGSKHVLDHHRDIVRIITELHQSQTTALDIESMDEEETKEFITNSILAELARTKRAPLRCVSDAEDEGDSDATEPESESADDDE